MMPPIWLNQFLTHILVHLLLLRIHKNSKDHQTFKIIIWQLSLVWCSHSCPKPCNSELFELLLFKEQVILPQTSLLWVLQPKKFDHICIVLHWAILQFWIVHHLWTNHQLMMAAASFSLLLPVVVVQKLRVLLAHSIQGDNNNCG